MAPAAHRSFLLTALSTRPLDWRRSERATCGFWCCGNFWGSSNSRDFLLRPLQVLADLTRIVHALGESRPRPREPCLCLLLQIHQLAVFVVEATGTAGTSALVKYRLSLEYQISHASTLRLRRLKLFRFPGFRQANLPAPEVESSQFPDLGYFWVHSPRECKEKRGMRNSRLRLSGHGLVQAQGVK